MKMQMDCVVFLNALWALCWELLPLGGPFVQNPHWSFLSVHGHLLWWLCWRISINQQMDLQVKSPLSTLTVAQSSRFLDSETLSVFVQQQAVTKPRDPYKWTSYFMIRDVVSWWLFCYLMWLLMLSFNKDSAVRGGKRWNLYDMKMSLLFIFHWELNFKGLILIKTHFKSWIILNIYIRTLTALFLEDVDA